MATKRTKIKTAGELDSMTDLVDQNRRPVAVRLVRELNFMSATLDKLRVEIERLGPVDLFKQGVQEFVRENPALKAYNTTIQRYSLLFKQLTDLIPREEPTQAADALLQFIQEN